MSAMVHEVFLRSDKHFGGKLPLHQIGVLLAELPFAIRAAVSMAFRHRSSIRGRQPAWFDRASDVRFVGLKDDAESVLLFEAEPLGEAAADLYAQKSLFPETDDRPAEDETAFDLLCQVLAEVRSRNADSVKFDAMLLRRIAKFGRVFKQGPFSEVDFTSRHFPHLSPARFTPELVTTARSLLGSTPRPQRVRIVGQLDGLVASTQTFSLLIDTGDKVMGSFGDDQEAMMQQLWRTRVLVLGTAVYRASGRLLRIDAAEVKPGENEPSVFSRLPTPPGINIDRSMLRKSQGPQSGINAIIGKWPGDETEEEITAILEELS